MSKVMTLRVDEALVKQLDRLGSAMKRSRSWVATEAIRTFVDANAWQVKAIQQAVERADRGEAKFVDHETVDEWLASWGSAAEKEPPKCD